MLASVRGGCRQVAGILGILGLVVVGCAVAAGKPSFPRKPNIIFVLADDLGYGELGCYGQRIIRTPHLDRMAAEGLRFTQMYAGSTVCAPSRCVLMTGLDTGRCHVRGNAGRRNREAQSLRPEDVTVAEVAHAQGYATALIGKWGLGEVDQPGHPLDQGFDYFFGYLNQRHAHNYWPRYLWRNRKVVRLANVVQGGEEYAGRRRAGWATRRVEYSHDLLMAEALKWIESHREGPFFLYLALTIPHANNEATAATGNGAEIPDYGSYADRPWPDPDKGHAAMIERLDRDMGRLLEKLRSLGIDSRTLVLFSSDNGPHLESGHHAPRFDPAGPLRGMKRDLTEGGIRVPFLAWWPGVVRKGDVTDHVGGFVDFFATVVELIEADAPVPSGSISFLPTLLGESRRQKTHAYLYWEFYERGSAQAIRFGKWKAIRKPMLIGPIELYDLSMDPGEKYNLGWRYRSVAAEARRLMKKAHVPHPNWKPPRRR